MIHCWLWLHCWAGLHSGLRLWTLSLKLRWSIGEGRPIGARICSAWCFGAFCFWGHDLDFNRSFRGHILDYWFLLISFILPCQLFDLAGQRLQVNIAVFEHSNKFIQGISSLHHLHLLCVPVWQNTPHSRHITNCTTSHMVAIDSGMEHSGNICHICWASMFAGLTSLRIASYASFPSLSYQTMGLPSMQSCNGEGKV